jgi:DNA-3-methyladenine glycosylase
MGGVKLPEDYYKSPAILVAPDLIGKLLCVSGGEGVIKREITETECYDGEDDTACHASKGKTNRTKVLCGRGGAAYIYLCYGIHALINVVTGPAGHPEAVLIRGVEGEYGPGKLTKAMGIHTGMNALSFVNSGVLWIEDQGKRPPFTARARIGINYASPEDIERRWRYTKKSL